MFGKYFVNENRIYIPEKGMLKTEVIGRAKGKDIGAMIGRDIDITALRINEDTNAWDLAFMDVLEKTSTPGTYEASLAACMENEHLRDMFLLQVKGRELSLQSVVARSDVSNDLDRAFIEAVKSYGTNE